MSTNRLERLTNILAGLLVAALALGAFIVNYSTLHNLALDTGAINPGLAWIWPLIVDGALIVFSVAVLRNSLLGESIVWPFGLVLLFSAFSTCLAVAHAPNTLLARVVSGTAPIALLLSFEVLMSQLRSEARRAGRLATLAAIQKEIEATRATGAAMVADIDALAQKRAAIQADIDALKAERRTARKEAATAAGEGDFINGDMAALELANDVRQENAQERKDKVLARIKGRGDGEYLTVRGLAGELGFSPATISRDVRELATAGLVHKNGNGLEPVTK